MKAGKGRENLNPEKLFRLYQDADEKSQLFLDTIRSLFLFIQDFSLDVSDIDAAGFKKEIERLNDKFLSSDKPKSIQSAYKKCKKTIPSFITRQKNYLDIREKEFKDIIDLLTKAITKINSADQAFNHKLFEQSEKMEEISRLDDIKRIKNALKDQIEQMRDVVQDKQSNDERQIRQLSGQVNSLRTELEKVKIEAMTDGLTGAYNRKSFDTFIRGLVERSSVMNGSFSLLMMDIDNFKTINDTHGHNTGDRVLLAFANKCREHIRDEDFFARYGGEEFVVVMPGASLRIAAKRGKQVCKAIAAARYALENVEPGEVLKITTSIGVGSWKKGDTAISIVQRADQALYMAKQTGKNRVVTEKKVK